VCVSATVPASSFILLLFLSELFVVFAAAVSLLLLCTLRTIVYFYCCLLNTSLHKSFGSPHAKCVNTKGKCKKNNIKEEERENGVIAMRM